jgi:putative membrane protein
MVALGFLGSLGCEKHEDAARTSQTGPSIKDNVAAAVGISDATFLSSAAQANMAEVAAGRLATKKSGNADVKRFGQHMIDDHSAANSELMDLAHKKEIPVSAQPDDAHQKDVAHLEGLSGVDFDRSYVAMMVTDHVKAVALFETYSREASDPEVRTFAQKTLPVLRDHLKMARDLAIKVAAPTSP